MSFGSFKKKRLENNSFTGGNTQAPASSQGTSTNQGSMGNEKQSWEGRPSLTAGATGQSDRPSLVGDSGRGRSSVRYTVNSRIAPGTRIKGGVFLPGAAEFGGELEGELVSEEHIIVADAGIVKGKIRGKNVTIHGAVEGDIIASGTLSLKAPARILGNVTCERLAIEDGVFFKGSCQMSIKETERQGERTVLRRPEEVNAGLKQSSSQGNAA